MTPGTFTVSHRTMLGFPPDNQSSKKMNKHLKGIHVLKRTCCDLGIKLHKVRSAVPRHDIYREVRERKGLLDPVRWLKAVSETLATPQMHKITHFNWRKERYSKVDRTRLHSVNRPCGCNLHIGDDRGCWMHRIHPHPVISRSIDANLSSPSDTTLSRMSVDYRYTLET